MPGGGGAVLGDEGGIDLSGEGDDAPSGDGDGFAFGVSADQDVEDFREEKASVDEEGRRVLREWGQPAREGRGRLE